jgi:hypothetical protein
MSTPSNPAVPPASAPATGPGTPPATPPAAPPVAPPAPPADANQLPPANGQPATGDPGQLGDPGKAALSAERQARKAAEKELREAREQLTALNQQGMSELERANARAAQLEQEIVTERAERLRAQVAVKYQIGQEDLVLLTGTSEEQLEAQAGRLAQLRNAQLPATPPPPVFAANPGQAAGNSTPPKAATVDAGRQLYHQKHKK